MLLDAAGLLFYFRGNWLFDSISIWFWDTVTTYDEDKADPDKGYSVTCWFSMCL